MSRCPSQSMSHAPETQSTCQSTLRSLPSKPDPLAGLWHCEKPIKTTRLGEVDLVGRQPLPSSARTAPHLMD